MRPRPSLNLFIFLACLGLQGAALAGQPGQPHTVLAANVLDLNLDVDSTMDIGGDTHFFSSRHRQYAGGRVTVHGARDPEKTLSTSTFGGFTWGRSAFMLNWEEPGLQSFPPLKSQFSYFTVPIGMDLNLQLGNVLLISPYASAKMMWIGMKVNIADDDFSGSAFKIGFDIGVRTALKLGSLTVTAGAGLNHIMNDEIEFEVDDLTFDSKTSGSSPEYFLGVEL